MVPSRQDLAASAPSSTLRQPRRPSLDVPLSITGPPLPSSPCHQGPPRTILDLALARSSRRTPKKEKRKKRVGSSTSRTAKQRSVLREREETRRRTSLRERRRRREREEIKRKENTNKMCTWSYSHYHRRSPHHLPPRTATPTPTPALAASSGRRLSGQTSIYLSVSQSLSSPPRAPLPLHPRLSEHRDPGAGHVRGVRRTPGEHNTQRSQRQCASHGPNPSACL